MQNDPMQEWQRLTEHYRRLSDEALLELAEDFGDLTDPAKQALRDEMRSRGLRDPGAPQGKSAQSKADARSEGPDGAAVHGEPNWPRDEPMFDGNEPDGQYEYTWKTDLCECETNEQAVQLGEVLRRAGIDSWIESSRQRSGLSGPRVMVAADQLEQARAIAAQPIPQDIVDELKKDKDEPEFFEAPVCLRCGTEDPVLEGTEPVNSWRCEECGAEWTDASDAQADAVKN